MKKTILIFLAICSTFMSCQKSDDSELGSNTDNSKIMNTVSNPFSALTDDEKDIIRTSTINIYDASTYIIAKIANSEISSAGLDALSNDNITSYGIFTQEELSEKLDIIRASSSIIKKNLNIEPCLDCYEGEDNLTKLKQLVDVYRGNPSLFTSFGLAFQEPSLFDTNPGCNLAFYACLVGCTGASTGLGAAACLYACACGFCHLKPPGCPL